MQVSEFFLQQKKYVWLFWLLVVVLALTPRMFDLDVFYARDELSIWGWADEFVLAIWAGDLAGTLTESDYPGIPLFWAHTLFLTLKYMLPSFFQETMIPADIIRQARGPEFLAERRLVGGIFAGLQIIAAVWLVRRLFGWRAALVSAIFLGLDPFSLTEARVLRLQMISSLFVGLSALAYFIYLRDRNRTWLLASGILGGLSASSQTSSGFLAPYIWLLLLLDFLFETTANGERRPWSVKLKQLIGNGLTWGGGAVAIFWLIWPSMWIKPLQSLEIVLDVGYGVVATDSIWHGLVFFWGQKFQDDPGLLFYPVVYAFRTTPLTWLGLAAALIFAAGMVYPDAKGVAPWPSPGLSSSTATLWGLPWPAVGILLLLAHILVITIELSLILSKVDRYLITVFPALNILSALGVVLLIEWGLDRISYRPNNLSRGWLFVGATTAILIIQLALMLPAHPYFFTYWNPLLGGSRAAVQTLPVGSGEGIDQVVNYVNQQPDAAQLKLICGASQPWCQNLFAGETLRFASYAGGRWLEADYASFYISHLQRDKYPPEVVDFFMAQTPVFEAKIDGATYAWLYEVPKIDHFAGAFNELIGLGQLYGYNLSPAAAEGATAQVGDTIEATIWWANFGAGLDNLVVRWVDASGYEWGRVKAVPQPDYTSIEAGKRTVVVSTATFTIPPGTPPGRYYLRIGILEPGQDRLLGGFDMPAQADQLVVNLGQPDPEIASAPPTVAVNQPLTPEITLLGYDPPEQVLTAALPTWLTLYWQATDSPLDYQVVLRLLDQTGAEAARWTGRPAQGNYAADLWRAGEIVKDVWPLQVPPETPVGSYNLEVALVDPTQPDHQSGVYTLENLEVWPQPLTYDVPRMQTELNANFGDQLTLLGYDLYFDTTGAGTGNLTPIFYWQSRLELQNAFDIRLTLRQANNPDQVVKTWQAPLGVNGPKRFWKDDEVINTIYQLEAETVSGDDYHLDISLQNVTTQEIEPVRQANSVAADFIRIENIQERIVVRKAGNQ